MGIGRCQREVVADAAAAVHLNCPVDHVASHVGRHHLDHRDLGAGHLVAGHVHQPGGLEREQPRHVDLAARLGDALLRDRLRGDGLAECHARRGALAHQFERALGQADQAHAVVDPARPEPALCDLETAPLAQQDAGNRHPHILEVHLDVAMRRVVVAEHGQRPHDPHALGVGRDQHHALLRVPRRFRIGLAHGDVDRAARVGGAGNPPLVAVDHVVVAVAFDPGRDVGRVRRGDVGLGHGERRTDLAFQQRLEPARLVFFRAVAGNGLHVAGVGRRAVEDFGRPWHPAHDLGQRRVFLVGQAGARITGGRRAVDRQEQVPQAGRAGLELELLDRLQRGPALAGLGVGRQFLLVILLGRIDVVVHELEQPGLQLLGFR